MNYTKQIDLFGNDITEQLQIEITKQKRKDAAKKAAETRKKNKEKLLKEIDKNFDIAFCSENGDLFGNIPTDDERQKAIEFLNNIKDKFNKN